MSSFWMASIASQADLISVQSSMLCVQLVDEVSSRVAHSILALSTCNESLADEELPLHAGAFVGNLWDVDLSSIVDWVCSILNACELVDSVEGSADGGGQVSFWISLIINQYQKYVKNIFLIEKLYKSNQKI